MAQQGRHSDRQISRKRGAALAGAGMAGLTAAFALAPLAAHADGAADPTTTTTVTPDPTVTTTIAPDPTGTTTIAADPTTTSPADPTTTGASDPTSTSPADPTTSAPAPDFGTNKIRIGVRIKDGSYAPGATTSGTVLTIVETGDGVDGGTLTTTCTTDDSDSDAPSTTFCTSGDPSDGPFVQQGANQYEAQPGDTVTITQKTVNAQLAIDTETMTFAPCVGELEDRRVAAQDDPPTCGTFLDPLEAIFTDPGLPPVAVDDSATTKVDTPVDIAVRGNDTPVDPDSTLTVASGPDHGSAAVDTPTAPPSDTTSASASASSSESAPPSEAIRAAAVAVNPGAGATSILYTPAAGFTGVDHFRYTITNANGSATALVTVTITGSGVSASTSSTSVSTPTAVTTSTQPVASTGTPTGQIVGVGAGLLAVGGLVTAAGVGRRRGRHSH